MVAKQNGTKQAARPRNAVEVEQVAGPGGPTPPPPSPTAPLSQQGIQPNADKTLQILKNTIGELNGQLAMTMAALEDVVGINETLSARIQLLEAEIANLRGVGA